jgi:hypothetical protein
MRRGRFAGLASDQGVPGAISQDGHEKSGMAKAMITMAVKDVHLALVQRASSAKRLGTVSSEFTCKLGTRTVAAAAAHLQQGQRGVAASTSLGCTLSMMN